MQADTIDNRKLGMDAAIESAIKGDVIALMTLDLMRIAEPLFVNQSVDWDDDEDSWSDVRPF